MFKRFMFAALLFVCALGNVPVSAANPTPVVYLDGQRLDFPVPPMIVEGTTLVPIRKLFESQGAKVSWDGDSQTVTAVKGDITFTYKIGERQFHKNDGVLQLPIPGRIVDGHTLFPLRQASEALGNTVAWDGDAYAVSIITPAAYETIVEWGVNLRSEPSSADEDSRVLRQLRKGEKIRVIEEIDAFWLKVETRDGLTGYVSAKPKYTDYASETLTMRRAEALIAYGEQFLGTPYEFGAAADQTDTFDCSSFTKHVFEEVLAIELPRISYQQAEEGEEVGLDDLRKGDLLFFTARGLPIGHVAIYAGDGMMLHTYSKKYGVRFEEFDGQWVDRFVTARRMF
jgi:cell wall-associated NlpC family hydrolase